MRAVMEAAPDPNDPELDPNARAWLKSLGKDVQEGTEPVVLAALAVDYDSDVYVWAIPASQFDETAHAQLQAVTGSAFEWHFAADLQQEQYAGALRFLSGRATDEPELVGELVEDLELEEDGDVEPALLEKLINEAGSWGEFEVESGASVGPISRVYTATLCM